MIICHVASKGLKLTMDIAPEKKMLGAMQGFILGPVFFSINLRDLFFVIDKFDIANLHHMLYDKIYFFRCYTF